MPHAPAASRSPKPLALVARSVAGRKIEAQEVRGAAAGAPVVLVIGCVDGDEPAGIEVVKRLRRLAPRGGVALWTVADVNPDGLRAGTRTNAHGVDLNRNFPFGWRALGVVGEPEYSGPHPLSEPETRFAYQLILGLRPRVTIWFHQPLGLVDESGGSRSIEQRFARLSGLPLRRLPDYPGAASSWQNHRLSGTTAFVVELPAGQPSAGEVRRWAAAVEGVAGLVDRGP
jgi:protein MpaA